MAKSTRDRVLDMSAELFNHYGIEAVSVQQIAEALNISPGNLTYYFKKKSDLLAAHIDQLEARLYTAVTDFPLYSDAKTFSKSYMTFLGMNWRYRFIYIGINYMIQNDLVDARRYNRLINNTKETFVKQIRNLVADGYMQPIKKPYSIDMLVDSIWSQWLGLLLIIQVSPQKKRIPEKRMLADAVLHILFVTHHYIRPEFFAAVRDELKHLATRSRADDE